MQNGRRQAIAAIGPGSRQAGGHDDRRDNASALRRIKADPPARKAVRERFKFGMTIVATDEPANAKTRPRDGFVVLNSAG